MRISVLYRYLAIISFFVIAVFVAYSMITKPKFTRGIYKESCLECHLEYGSLSDSHDVEVFGCAKCHGGNPSEDDKSLAHKDMVINPSYLHHAGVFCGSCHEDIVNRVSLSIMQTQKGIKDVMHEQWVEKSTTNLSKEKMKELANSHINKGCLSCHVNQDESAFFDKNQAKGGGCADCHRVEKDTKTHPKFSTKIPSSNCLKCHNRSNRIGLSYFGKFESEGYGTPFREGNLSNRLDNHRFFYELPSDTHHQNLGLDCIDCHTSAGVMGDGAIHSHMEYALDIACKDCHSPKFAKSNALSAKLGDLNGLIPHSDEVAYTHKKNSPLYNLKKEGENLRLYRKRDGKFREFFAMSDEPYHSLEIHKNLECSACHVKWMPSCYGCHEVYFDKGEQFDWANGEMSKGVWLELRSFLRFEEPSLGVGYNGKIMPFAPGCQVIGSVFEDGDVKSFHAMAMAGWEPHTTGKSKECTECHFSSAALGFGRGNLDYRDGKLSFTPYYDSLRSGQPFSYPIDAFVSDRAKQYQSTSREAARALNMGEIERITGVYKCIICHREWGDKIYTDFNASKVKFEKGLTPCLD